MQGVGASSGQDEVISRRESLPLSVTSLISYGSYQLMVEVNSTIYVSRQSIVEKDHLLMKK